MWLYTFLRETNIMPNYYNGNPGEPEVSVWTSLPKACLEHATIMDIFMRDSLQPTLFPLTLEFMLTSCEILIDAWYLRFEENNDIATRRTMRRRGTTRTARWRRMRTTTRSRRTRQSRRRRNRRNMRRRTTTRTPNTGPPPQPNKHWVRFLGLFNITLPILLIMTEAVVIQFCLLHEEYQHYYEHHDFVMLIKLPTVCVRIILICIPGLFVVSHCIHVIKTFEKKPDTTEDQVKGSDIVVHLAAAGVIGLTFTEVILSSSHLQLYGLHHGRWIYSLGALESLLYMPQIILTAVLIRLGHTREVDTSHLYYSTIDGALNFLTVYSFGRWVIDSFLETEYLVSRDDFPHSWHICVQLFLPFCIYFRFVSVLLLLKIKVLFTQTAALTKTRRRESPPPPAQADIGLPDWLFGPDTECLIDAQEEPPMANPGSGLHVQDAQPSTSRLLT